MQSASNVAVEKDTVEGLPPGWIKEIRIRADRMKKDPFYIDPGTGYVFRSKKDVFRYLESGDVGSCRCKVKQRCINNVESIDDEIYPPTAAKSQKIRLQNIYPRRASKRLAGLPAELAPDGESTGLSSLALQEADGLKNRLGNRICAENRFVSAPAAKVSPEKQSLDNGVKKHENRNTWLSASNSKSKKQLLLPHRASKRLAGLPAELAPDGESTGMSSLALQEAEDLKKRQGNRVCAENRFVLASAAKASPEKQSLDNGAKKHENKKTWLNASNSKRKKKLFLLCRASKRLAGLPEELAPDLVTTDWDRQMAVRQTVGLSPGSCSHWASEQLDPLETALETEPAPHSSKGAEVLLNEEPSMEGEKPVGKQVALEGLTRMPETEKQDNEKPESSPLILPFGDSWPDPCLEFAFKTLTGEIPVEDNLVIEDYFQQHLSMGQNQRSGFTSPDLGLDNFCQTDVLFQFGTPEITVSKQQSLMKSTFPSLGNGGLASSSENVLQQPNGEGKKECRRKVVVEKDTAEGLPPGWIKEVRVRADKKKRDPFYIDPGTGYVFGSKLDVFRYLESGDLGSCRYKVKQRCINNIESIDDEIYPPTAVKGQKLAGNATRRCLFTGHNSKSSKIVEDELIQESSMTEDCFPLSKHALNQYGESTGLSSLNQQEVEGVKTRQGNRVSAENWLVSAPAAEFSAEKQPLENGVEKRGNKKIRHCASKSKGKKILPLPHRASKRLARVPAELKSDLVTTDLACRMAASQSSHLKANPAVNPIPSSCSRQASERFDPLEATPEIESAPHCSIAEEVLLDEGSSKEVEEPIGNQALGKLTGVLETEKQDNEKPESPLMLPFGDSWPDPCLEFAFKTLTGAIPLEDNLELEDYFQQQLSMGQNQGSEFALPDLGSDGFCQTDLFQFGAPEKTVSEKHSLMKPIFPSLGNGGLGSSGENILQKPNGEGNKECQKR